MANGKKHPIILAHGFARFDILLNAILPKVKLLLIKIIDLTTPFDKLHYFKGIASHLRKNGFEVYHTNVSFGASLETRAKDLCKEIIKILNETGHKKVHIIAHSMGGLDARKMIVDENMADKVATLTTIATPHFGTCWADWALKHGGDDQIEKLRAFIDLEGARDLTRAAAKKFNDRVRAQEATNSVVYQTYFGQQERQLVFSYIQDSWDVISQDEGANDGLVPVTSQKWEEKLVGPGGIEKKVNQKEFPFPVDHLNEIGWWDLHELQNMKWWQFWRFREIREFERKVKNVYLTMAEDARLSI